MSPRFLTLAEVLAFHEDLIESFGGSQGIRDLGLAEAAIAMPASGSGESFFHEFPFEMAAAYAFHLAKNHPFIDGNKRTAMASALAFLEINGHPILGGEKELENATRALAMSKLDKPGFAALLKRLHDKYRHKPSR